MSYELPTLSALSGYASAAGSYQEVRCIAPEGAEVAAPPFEQDGPARDYLLLGFKSVEESFSQVSCWSGYLLHDSGHLRY